MVHPENKVRFEWTISLGNMLSLLGIITTVGSAMLYVRGVEAKVDLVDQRVTNENMLNVVRKQARDQQLDEMNDRLKGVEGNVNSILLIVTKDPRDAK